MSFHDRVIDEGVKRLSRQGKVTLGQTPEGMMRFTNPLSPRRKHPENWPTRVVPPDKRDPKTEYKMASHKARSLYGPRSGSRALREPEEVEKSIYPRLKTKKLRREELLAKRKELQQHRKRVEEE